VTELKITHTISENLYLKEEVKKLYNRVSAQRIERNHVLHVRNQS
jgi:hypothetical protein